MSPQEPKEPKGICHDCLCPPSFAEGHASMEDSIEYGEGGGLAYLLLLSEEGGEEPEDYDGADDGDEELTETAVACGADAEELEDPAAYCRTYYTEDEVKDAAVAAIAFDTAGDVASDDTENDYINPVHVDEY